MINQLQTLDIVTWKGPRVSTCAICGESLSDGQSICDVAKYRTALRLVGLSKTKVFKYAHIKCIPAIPDSSDLKLLRNACENLAALPPPTKLRDDIGLSGSSDRPVRTWINEGSPEISAQRVARLMIQHIETQLDGVKGETGLAILRIAKAQNALTIRAAKIRAQITKEVARTPEYQALYSEGILVKTAVMGSPMGSLIRIHWNGSRFDVGFTWDPDTKDLVKGTGCRWDPNGKTWYAQVETLVNALDFFGSEACEWTSQAIEAFDRLNIPKVQIELSKVLVDTREVIQGSQRVNTCFVDTYKGGLGIVFDYPKTPEQWAFKDSIARFCSWKRGDLTWATGAKSVLDNLHLLQNAIFSPNAVKAIQACVDRANLTSGKTNLETIQANINAMMPVGLELYPFQALAVEFIRQSKGRALLADDMGLGKTITALAYLTSAKVSPTVVVVPSIMSTKWATESTKWCPNKIVHRVKTGKEIIPSDAQIVVITYGLVSKQLERLKALKPMGVVLDESHYIKNPKAKRTTALLSLCQGVDHVVALSGTPITNRPVEFYNTLNLLRPADFPSWYKFACRYCDGHQTRYGFDSSGSSNIGELRSKLTDIMIRRTKDQVLDLPGKMREITAIPNDATGKREYKALVKELKTQDKMPGAALAAITALRHKVGEIKGRLCKEWIEFYRDQGQPLVVFAHHKTVLDSIQAQCVQIDGTRHSRIDGSTPTEKRGEIVDAFQDGKVDVLILSLQAANVGITLTRASQVLFVERDWTPANEEQGEDRLYRIGQKQAVNVKYLSLEGTIDDKMGELIEDKRRLISEIMDGTLPSESLDIRQELADYWEKQ